MALRHEITSLFRLGMDREFWSKRGPLPSALSSDERDRLNAVDPKYLDYIGGRVQNRVMIEGPLASAYPATVRLVAEHFAARDEDWVAAFAASPEFWEITGPPSPPPSLDGFSLPDDDRIAAALFLRRMSNAVYWSFPIFARPFFDDVPPVVDVVTFEADHVAAMWERFPSSFDRSNQRFDEISPDSVPALALAVHRYDHSVAQLAAAIAAGHALPDDLDPQPCGVAFGYLGGAFKMLALPDFVAAVLVNCDGRRTALAVVEDTLADLGVVSGSDAYEPLEMKCIEVIEQCAARGILVPTV